MKITINRKTKFYDESTNTQSTKSLDRELERNQRENTLIVDITTAISPPSTIGLS